jgi:hypothetical protein
MTRPAVAFAAGRCAAEIGLCFLAFLSPLSVLMVYCMMFFGFYCACNYTWLTFCGQWALYTLVIIFWMARWIRWVVMDEDTFDPIVILVVAILYTLVRGIHLYVGIAKVKDETERAHFSFGLLSCVVSVLSFAAGALVITAFCTIFFYATFPDEGVDVGDLTWQLDVVRIFQTDGDTNRTLAVRGEEAATFTEATYGPDTAAASIEMVMYPSGAVLLGFVCCGFGVAHLKATVQHCQLGWIMHDAAAKIAPPPPLMLRDNNGIPVRSRNFAVESQENGFITDSVARAAKGGPAFNAAEYRAQKHLLMESKKQNG